MVGLRHMDRLRFQSYASKIQNKILTIYIHDYKSTEFCISFDSKKLLLTRGYEKMEEFLNPAILLISFIKQIYKIIFYLTFCSILKIPCA